ncbi:MAG: hypothetical protein ACOYEP_03435 [Limnochordia bacterium]
MPNSSVKPNRSQRNGSRSVSGARVYACPVCKTNTGRFHIVYKLIQEIHQDPDSGRVLYRSDELETMTKGDGQPDLDIRCQQCEYVGQEAVFIRQAQRR